MYEFIIGIVHWHLVGMPTSGQRQMADQIPINYFSIINCQRWYDVGLMLARCRPIGKPSSGDVGPTSPGQLLAKTSGGGVLQNDRLPTWPPDVSHIGQRTLARRWPNFLNSKAHNSIADRHSGVARSLPVHARCGTNQRKVPIPPSTMRVWPVT